MPRALRTIARAAGAAFVLVAAFVVANTLRVTAPPAPALRPAPPPAVAGDVVAAHLVAAIRVDTVSHEDDKQDDPAKLAALRALLRALYPRAHAALTVETVGGALLYTWKGSDPSLQPALFAAHMDVVPIEPGTEGAWEQPPFSGAVAGGFVWGRGALDDKGALVCLLDAAESLLAEGFAPRRTVLLAFGSDEEVGGLQGAKAIAATLAARGVRLEYALDEGMAVTEGVVPDVDRQVAVIGLGEKGLVTVELSIDAPGGHSSMPPAETAISVLAGAVDRLARSPMPARLTETSRLQLALMAPYLPFSRRLAVANLWLFAPLVRSALARQPVTGATVRTTTAPTMFEAGMKENVLPSRARAVVNFRILPGDSIEGVLVHVRRVVDDDRVHLRTIGKLTGNPPPLAPSGSRAYRLLASTVQRFYPGAVVVPGLVLGATDGRHYAAIADGVYHFAPVVLRDADRARLHGTNERVGVRDLEIGVGFYRQLFRDGPEP
jgi:carboxypeptidase PM20D1